MCRPCGTDDLATATIDGDTHTAYTPSSAASATKRRHIALCRFGFEQRVVDDRGHFFAAGPLGH